MTLSITGEIAIIFNLTLLPEVNQIVMARW